MPQGAACTPSCETTEMSLVTWPLPTHPTLFLTAGPCPSIPRTRTKQTARCWPCRPILPPSWASVSTNTGRTTGSEGMGDSRWGPVPASIQPLVRDFRGPGERVSPAVLPTLCHLPLSRPWRDQGLSHVLDTGTGTGQIQKGHWVGSGWEVTWELGWNLLWGKEAAHWESR